MAAWIRLSWSGREGHCLPPRFNLGVYFFGENHVAVDVPGSAALIGTVSEHPEDNLLSGFECGDFEN
jgi:hypothetical protein